MREENRKKEATRRERSHRKHEKGENAVKEEQEENGLRTSPHTNALRSERNPQKDKKDKTTNDKNCFKDSLRKKKALQSKTKTNKSQDTEIEMGRQNRS